MDRRKLLLVVAVLVAALGAGLVFLYAQNAEDRAAETVDTPMVTVIVATQLIPAGQLASDAAADNKLQSREIPADQVLEGATNNGEEFQGLVALTTIYPGEQLLPVKFGASSEVTPTSPVVPPKGKGAMQLSIDDPNHVGSFLQAGSHVAIFQSPCAKPTLFDPKNLNRYDAGRARVVLPDALILGVGDATVSTEPQVDANGNPIPAAASTSITIAVDEREAVILGGLGYNPAAPLFFVLKNDDTVVRSAGKLEPQPVDCGAGG